ncbi:MAG: glycoside hydrolase family 65 protein, partial [Gammaproteobacteria bacterium]
EMTESIYAVGNGYIGMRGCTEEGGPLVQNGTFINGFYESWPIVYGEEAFGFAKTGQTIVNATDSKIIKLYVDDEPFWLARANLLRYDRRLNMRVGTLDREVLWETPSGTQVLIESRRLASFQHRHVAAISYRVTVLNATAPVVISSEVVVRRDSNDEDETDPRLARTFADDVLRPTGYDATDQRVVLCHETYKSGMGLACAIDHQLDTSCGFTSDAACWEDAGRVVFTVDAQPGQAIELGKYMAYHTSTTASPGELRARAERTVERARSEGLAALLAGQRQYMDEFWSRSDLQISDVDPERAQRTTVEVQQALRFNVFHILQASARADTTGVPAKGLTGQAYEGHYFWDTEIYLLPFLTYTAPRIAKNLLLFRYRMLNQARARARELNQKGAMYPWRTINGEEASAYYAAGTAQYHINGDIVYALRKYVNATGDEAFLHEYGAEMLIETARLWADLGFFSAQNGGQFCIHGVTGPDEYNTVVDNNTYTNLLARDNLRYATTTLNQLRDEHPERFAALVSTTNLELEEIEAWQLAADNMYVPFDEATGIYPQDDSFLEKEAWDFEHTPRENYPLLLFYHPLVIYRHRVIKQADIVLAMFLFGEEFSQEQKKRNFDYYDPLTTGDSSLSSCIQSIMAAEIGYADTATEYARAAILMDLADVGGNVKDGCHIASMGGTWMLVVYGMAGMRDYDGVLSFRPRRSAEQPARIRFPLAWHGQILDVDMGPDGARYSLREGSGLAFRHDDEDIELTPATPIVTRPILEITQA